MTLQSERNANAHAKALPNQKLEVEPEAIERRNGSESPLAPHAPLGSYVEPPRRDAELHEIGLRLSVAVSALAEAVADLYDHIGRQA